MSPLDAGLLDDLELLSMWDGVPVVSAQHLYVGTFCSRTEVVSAQHLYVGTFCSRTDQSQPLQAVKKDQSNSSYLRIVKG